MYQFGIENRQSHAVVCSIVGTLTVFLVGYLRNGKGLGHHGFHESGMHVHFEEVSAGAFATNLERMKK
jgi:hypothetical protein